MQSKEIQELTASEPLTIEQEYEMQQSWLIDDDSMLCLSGEKTEGEGEGVCKMGCVCRKKSHAILITCAELTFIVLKKSDGSNGSLRELTRISSEFMTTKRSMCIDLCCEKRLYI